MKADVLRWGFEEGVNMNFQQGVDLSTLIQMTKIKAKIKLCENENNIIFAFQLTIR